jgi:hypothetical protein
VDVYYNGSKLAPSEFTATTGTSIVLATACQAGDIVDVVAYVTGVTGSSGTSGTSGSSATSGSSGSSGTSASSGSSGTSASSGSSGTSASSGSSGTSGSSATSGTSGSSGTTGTSGSAGTSGAGTISGTVNYVAKFTGASTRGDSQIFDNGTNVGIGTATPYQLLQVSSGTNFGAALKVSDTATQSTGAIALGDGGSSTLGIGMWRAAENSYSTQGNWLNIQGISGIAFMSGTGAFGSNTKRMTLDASGNLGLGVTPSAWGSGYIGVQYGTAGSQMSVANNNRVGLNYYFDGASFRTIQAGTSSFIEFDGDNIFFKNAASVAANATQTLNTRLLITSGGNVLIGTTTDAGQKLQVNGNIAINKGAGNTAIFDSSGTVLSLATGGTVDFAVFSGMLMVTNFNTGAFQIFVCGGGSTASVYLLGGAIGTFAYNIGINGYTFTSSAATATFNFTAFRTRPNA